MFRAFSFIAALCALTACASTPAYGPAAGPGAAGYSATQVENDRYFVTYRAAGAADAAMLQDFALLRAAEITLERGGDWFWVDRRSLDEDAGAPRGPSVGIGVGGGSFGRHTGVNVGVGVNIPLGGGGAPKARAATVEIRLGQGPKPDDPNAYDAHALAANIRARLMPAR